jgi:hypothetical protein
VDALMIIARAVKGAAPRKEAFVAVFGDSGV